MGDVGPALRTVHRGRTRLVAGRTPCSAPALPEEPGQSMTCPDCRTPTPASARFCPSRGQPLAGDRFRQYVPPEVIAKLKAAPRAAPGGGLEAERRVVVVVVVLGDLHRADAASLALLLHLFALVAEVSLLFVCALRPDRATPAGKLGRTARVRQCAVLRDRPAPAVGRGKSAVSRCATGRRCAGAGATRANPGPGRRQPALSRRGRADDSRHWVGRACHTGERALTAGCPDGPPRRGRAARPTAGVDDCPHVRARGARVHLGRGGQPGWAPGDLDPGRVDSPGWARARQ
jgi:hypothetical protein